MQLITPKGRHILINDLASHIATAKKTKVLMYTQA